MITRFGSHAIRRRYPRRGPDRSPGSPKLAESMVATGLCKHSHKISVLATFSHLAPRGQMISEETFNFWQPCDPKAISPQRRRQIPWQSEAGRIYGSNRCVHLHPRDLCSRNILALGARQDAIREDTITVPGGSNRCVHLHPRDLCSRNILAL